MHHQLNTEARPSTTSVEWFETFNAISRTPMNGDTKAVLMAVFSYADGPGRPTLMGNARPGVKRLVEHTGLGRSTVLRKLSELADEGWLQITAKGGGSSATTYRVAVPELARPASGTTPVPEAGPLPSRKRDTTDSVPTHDQRNLFTATPSRGGEMSTEGEGDRIPAVVLDAVQALADAPMNLDTIEAFEDVVAPVYGREVAEYITGGTVNFSKGLTRYDAGKRLRQVLATARREGVGVLRMPAPRNTVDLESAESRAIREEFEASLASAKLSAPVSGPDVVEDVQEDLEAVPAAPAPVQAPAAPVSEVVDFEAHRQAQLVALQARMVDAEKAEAAREAAAAREARWADMA